MERNAIITTYIAATLVMLSHNATASSVLGSDNPAAERTSMLLNEGDSEINLSFEPGLHDSLDPLINGDLAYRYFFFDDIAIGLMADYRNDSKVSAFSAGVSARWYFARAGKWAFNLDQNILYRQTDIKHLLPTPITDDYVMGETLVGANYFITPSTSIGAFAGLSYKFNKNFSPSLVNGLNLTFRF